MTTPSLSLRSEADLLALIPHTFGFHPENSLVLVSIGPGRQPFHARIDLPDGPDELAEVVGVLVHAAIRNRAEHAFLVGYSDDVALVEDACALLAEALEGLGVEVVVVLRADGERWYPLGLEDLDVRSFEGIPYDVRTHELTTQGVLAGRVTYRNREELADSLSPLDAATVEEVAEAHDRLEALPGSEPSRLAEEGRWLVAQVRTHLDRRVVPGPVAVARVLRAVADPDVRDLVWCEIDRDEAERHASFWREVVRRSPERLVSPAAGLLAFAAWLAGDGALAWCAVDRSLRADPDHTLAHLVSQALEQAMPPTAWTRPDPGSLRLSAG
jgi:hypothetical protein